MTTRKLILPRENCRICGAPAANYEFTEYKYDIETETLKRAFNCIQCHAKYTDTLPLNPVEAKKRLIIP